MEKTTLILGAGFSIPYGYPSGKDLIKHIRDMRNIDGDRKINDMKQTIKYTKIRSIDSFLNAHKDFHSIGIEQIARVLYDTERTYIYREFDEIETEADFEKKDIIEVLLNKIEEEEFHKFNIITFNYDRHLEWSFYMKLLFKYNGDQRKAMVALGKLNIIHVHGSMIPFSKYKTDGTVLKKGQWVPYGIQTTHEDPKDIYPKEMYQKLYLDYAQQNIKTIYTNDSMNEEIKTILQASTRVFFLGFAFEEKNMALLGITPENVKYQIPYFWSARTVSGTCFGMEAIELNKIKRLFPILGGQKLKELNCREFFTKEFSLTSPIDDLPINTNKYKQKCCDMIAVQSFPYEQAKKVDRFTDRLPHNVKCIVCNTPSTKYFDRTASNEWHLARNV